MRVLKPHKIVDGISYRYCFRCRDYFPIAKLVAWGYCKECFYLQTSEAREKRTGQKADPDKRLVPFSKYAWILDELIIRVGKAEAARRIGTSKQYMWKLTTDANDKRYLRRGFARQIVTALIEVRKEDIVRHKKDIRRGSAIRGEKERKPSRSSEFYSYTPRRQCFDTANTDV